MALAEKRFTTALAEFGQANQRDPRVLRLVAVAAGGAGDSARASAFATKAAQFNEISFNFAYVKNKARRLPGTGVNERF